jgi:hypothetical protein
MIGKTHRSIDVWATRAREGHCDGVHVDQKPGSRKHERADGVRVPTNVVGVDMRKNDDVDLPRLHAVFGERRQEPALALRVPVPQSGRADAGVGENRSAGRANEVGDARDTPAVSREEVGIQLAIRVPGLRRSFGEQFVERPEQTDRIDERHELDRPDYHRTRAGAGSP